MLSGARDPEWKTSGFQESIIALIKRAADEALSLDSLRIDAEDSGTMAGTLAGRIEPDPQNPPKFILTIENPNNCELIRSKRTDALANQDLLVGAEDEDILVIGTGSAG